ncbi:MAG: flippase [Actinobacteria bacterium]|nr:flippase [Actinomycetota bacterium]
MERVGRLTRNTAALVAAKVVTSGLTFLLAVMINRELGPERAGIYNYAFALYTIFQVIPDFGLGNISIRDISQDDSRMRRYLVNIVSMRLLLGCAAFILLMATNLVSTALQGGGSLGGEKFWVVFAISFSLLVEQPLSNSLAENFIALERLVLVSGVYLIMAVLRVALSIYVISAGWSNVLVWLMLIYILTYVYSLLHLYPLYRRLLRKREAAAVDPSAYAAAEAILRAPEMGGEAPVEALLADYSYATIGEEARGEGGAAAGVGVPETAAGGETPADAADVGERGVATAAAGIAGPPPAEKAAPRRLAFLAIDTALWRYLLGSAWPLAVVATGVVVYAGIDIPILSWLKGDTEVGLYGAAGMFAKAFVFLTLAINMAVLPAVSRVAGKYPQRLGEIWERLLRYALFLIAPLVVILPVLARPVLVLQEHQFVTAWHAAWLTMAAMNFTFMTAICFPFFIVIDRQKEISKLVVFSVLLKAGLDFATIPFWGYTGAAITVLVSECVVFLVLAWLLSRELSYRPRLLRLAGAPLLVTGTLYGVSGVLYAALGKGGESFASSMRHALLVSLVLVAVYLLVGFAAGAFRRRDLRELNELLTA